MKFIIVELNDIIKLVINFACCVQIVGNYYLELHNRLAIPVSTTGLVGLYLDGTYDTRDSK